jgi:restriction system protein
MARRREHDDGVTLSVFWIVLFFVLAGVFWPRLSGVVFVVLAYVGILHLIVLAYEQVARPRFRKSMSPQEFEHYCAAVLQERRWKTRVTRMSGDQGVDIVAEKRGLRIAIQCKKYSKPVGNQAVQEVVAAMAHVGAQRGVVVTTLGYTPAAERLAASNRVLLLLHSDLGRIDKLLSRSRV